MFYIINEKLMDEYVISFLSQEKDQFMETKQLF